MNALAIPALLFGLFGIGEADYTSISVDDKTYSVLIADNPFEQMRGLMGRSSLGYDEGMLFIYEENRNVSFWMKNVSFPLDMIFLNQCGRVIQIHENAQAHDTTVILSVEPVRAVLELQAGASKRDEIRVGDLVETKPLVFENC